MEFLKKLLEIIEFRMQTPRSYGAYHIAWILITAGVTVLICWLYKRGKIKNPMNVVFYTAMIVSVLEIYKQIVFNVGIEWGALSYDYQWYIFPWQFCSTPMYVGLLAGISYGKMRNWLNSYLATFSIFAGLTVMVYPSQVYVAEIGINIQTMVCHASMIVVGVFLYYTGLVKPEFKTLFKAMAVFAAALCVAIGINEIAYYSGLLATGETVNMFYVSRHCAPSLPVYSIVQEHVPYPWCLLIYIAGFTAAACVILLIAKLAGKTKRKTKKVA